MLGHLLYLISLTIHDTAQTPLLHLVYSLYYTRLLVHINHFLNRSFLNYLLAHLQYTHPYISGFDVNYLSIP